VFKRFFIGFCLGMAATHYAITSSLPLLDDFEGWLRGTQYNYTGQRSHKAAEQVFDHERR
jgi:hypothetical protein